jgi:transforming growth factor-beta-induced protein
MRLRTIALSGLLMVGGGAGLEAQQRGNSDIILTLRNAGNFTWFLRAVEGAGLTQQLKSGQFTVFAPTDDAFGRIPGSRRDSLLRDPAELERVIRNHVVEGRLTAAEARNGGRGMSFMGGGSFKVDTTGSYTRVNGAQIIKADMAASNGVIHVVDQVWLPPFRARVRGTTPEDSAGRAAAPPNR